MTASHSGSDCATASNEDADRISSPVNEEVAVEEGPRGHSWLRARGSFFP